MKSYYRLFVVNVVFVALLKETRENHAAMNACTRYLELLSLKNVCLHRQHASTHKKYTFRLKKIQIMIGFY